MPVRGFFSPHPWVKSFLWTESQDTTRETCPLTPTEAAYIAGLADGEGTVTFIRKHHYENRQLSISICNTERTLLESVPRDVAAGKITGERASEACHTPSFTYAVDNRRVLNLLIQTQAYLRTYNARRAELIVCDYIAMTPRNGKYASEQRQARAAFEKSLLSIEPS